MTRENVTIEPAQLALDVEQKLRAAQHRHKSVLPEEYARVVHEIAAHAYHSGYADGLVVESICQDGRRNRDEDRRAADIEQSGGAIS